MIKKILNKDFSFEQKLKYVEIALKENFETALITFIIDNGKDISISEIMKIKNIVITKFIDMEKN